MPEPELVRDLHARMVRIRKVEKAVAELRAAGELPGLAQLSVGAEAVAAGVCATLRSDDQITSTHRPHGHLVAKGARLEPIFAELLGRAGGTSGGRSGSMGLVDPSVGMLGAYGIVGAGLPVAVGAAFANRHQGLDRVAVAFFGDGATNIGAFHEALNLAAARALPVVFVCENDDIALSTPRRDTMVIDDIADRGIAYGIAAAVVDGSDVLAVHEAAAHAVATARRGHGPSLIDARLQRWSPDVEPAPETGAIGDPITQLEDRLLLAGHVDARTLEHVHVEIGAEVDQALEQARGIAAPDADDLLDNVTGASLVTRR